MGDVQRVDPSALYRQAAEMLAQRWHNPNAEAVMPPDALPSSSAAAANLNDNAKSLLEFQEWAEIENHLTVGGCLGLFRYRACFNVS